MLLIPNLQTLFKLYTDVSGTGVSALLVQGRNLIKIFNARFSETEKLYSAIEKEMLSFRNLVWNTIAHIFTDNGNLTYDSFALSRIIHKWKLVLSDF